MNLKSGKYQNNFICWVDNNSVDNNSMDNNNSWIKSLTRYILIKLICIYFIKCESLKYVQWVLGQLAVSTPSCWCATVFFL
jgi:hypothetical protein